MKKVLILGARSPTSLEWVHAFFACGWQITLADSLSFPFSRYSNCVEHYLRLPPPKQSFKAWQKKLVHYVKAHQIDWVIPTCEEAFYLSAAKNEFPETCHIFTSDIALMAQLHHKGKFAELTQGWCIAAPETIILSRQTELDLFAQDHNLTEWVLKPAYSRFSTRTLIRPEIVQLKNIFPTEALPWVAQKYIPGKEYCSYSIFNQGTLIAHSCYHSRYRIGQGAGIYFESELSPEITRFIQDFGVKTACHGQVGFDFMCDQSGQFYVLECNPRATSGIHLFSENMPQLIQKLTESGEKTSPLLALDKSRMVALAMLSHLLDRKGWQKKFWPDFFHARDVIWRKGDLKPFCGQVLNVSELLLRAIKYHSNILAVTTRDIEWDGLPIDSVQEGK